MTKNVQYHLLWTVLFHATTAATWINRQIYGDSLEFYHDKGGLMTSKQGFDATKTSVAENW
jgi:hypothetical protein